MVVDDQIMRISSSFTAFAPAITVTWVASDLESFTPASAPLLQLREAAFTVSSSGNRSTGSSQPNSSELTTGSKVGIGIGVPIGVVLVIAISGCLMYRRSQRSAKQHVSADPSIFLAESKPELGCESQVHEIDSRRLAAEADESNARHELEGNQSGYNGRRTVDRV